MNRTIPLLFLLVVGLLFLPVSIQAQTVDSVGAGFTQALRITENADTSFIDAVSQMAVGGLDLNQNGKNEFLYITDNTFTGGRQTSAMGYSLYLYEYDATSAKYSLIWKYTINETVGGSFPVFSIADLNGNGKKEIVLPVQYGGDLPTPGANPDRLQIFEFGAGALPTTPTATWTFDAPAGSNTRPSAIVTGDVDGDGKEEVGIAFRAFSGSAKGIIIASVQGDFAGPLTTFNKEVYDTTTALSTIFGTARITDLDNDGKKEFCFAYSNGIVVLYEATAANTYSRVQWDLKKGTGLTNGPILSMQQVDINRDGKNELVWGRQAPANLYIVADVTDLATFDSSKVFRIGGITNVSGTTINEFRGLAAGDFDGNGKIDLFGGNGGRIWRYEYKGTGSISDSSSYTTSIVYQDTTGGTRFRWISFTGDVWVRSMGIVANDMDGDSKPELLIANQRGGSPDIGTSKIVIIESTVATEVEINGSGEVVRTFSLFQNYPNPFNPSTKIEFALTQSADVRLEVYDIAGRRISTLVNSRLTAGKHTVAFDGANLPSGTYIYVLESGSSRLSKKMMLVK